MSQDVSTLLERDRVGARVDRVDKRPNRLEVEMAELRAARKQAAEPEALPKKPAYKLYLVLQPATQLVRAALHPCAKTAPVLQHREACGRH